MEYWGIIENIHPCLYVVDDHNCQVILIHGLQAVDDVLVQPFRSENLENPSQHHEIKICHLVIVQDSCPLISAVSCLDGISGLIYPVVDSSVVTS